MGMIFYGDFSVGVLCYVVLLSRCVVCFGEMPTTVSLYGLHYRPWRPRTQDQPREDSSLCNFSFIMLYVSIDTIKFCNRNTVLFYNLLYNAFTVK